jgi:hypothetical protein
MAHVVIDVGGREVRLSNPGKVFFPACGWTELDLAHGSPRRPSRARKSAEK